MMKQRAEAEHNAVADHGARVAAEGSGNTTVDGEMLQQKASTMHDDEDDRAWDGDSSGNK